MAAPRVFVSSTYYDLRHVREVVREFIESLGYEAVLSEFSDVYYRPSSSVQNSCLEEIRRCDMFVLIVGGRYGSLFPDGSLSITHLEYREAMANGIPLFTLVDHDVLHAYRIYEENLTNGEIQREQISYGMIDPRVFDLVSEVMRADRDNAVVPFRSMHEILTHLRKQWARMFLERALFPFRKRHAQQEGTPTAGSSAAAEIVAFASYMNQLGLPAPDAPELQFHPTLPEFLKGQGVIPVVRGSTVDLNTDAGTVSIGRVVFAGLANEYLSLRKLAQ